MAGMFLRQPINQNHSTDGQLAHIEPEVIPSAGLPVGKKIYIYVVFRCSAAYCFLKDLNI